MSYNGFQSVKAWIDTFRNLKDYPWDVKIFRGIDINTNESVRIVNVTARTPTAANVVHVFAMDYSKELAEFIGPLDDILSHGFTVKKLEEVIA